jgi:hypothetical protein
MTIAQALFDFTATIHGDELELTIDLVDGYVDSGKTEMKARRD